MVKVSLLRLVGIVGLMAVLAAQANAASVEKSEKNVEPQMGKLEEADVAGQIAEPNYGYVGNLGTFQATTKGEALATFVIHDYPDTAKFGLGSTKLEYVGAKHIGDVDGWVFKTTWDGKNYPSKIFLSAQEVYFGGGSSAFIIADYRDATGWTWKLHPMRRMELIQK